MYPILLLVLVSQSFIHLFPQTLITLDLGRNQIGDQGAEHLANALQQNKVRVSILLLLLVSQLLIYLFPTDTHDTHDTSFDMGRLVLEFYIVIALSYALRRSFS